MSALNAFSCLEVNINTGIGACQVNFKNIIGLILTPKNFSVTTASLANFRTALVNAAQAAAKSARIYPVYDLRPLADNSEEVVIQTFSTGQRQPVRDGMLDWKFQFVAGGIDLLKKLRLVNQASSAFDFLFVDANNTVIGVADEENDKLKAISSNDGFFWAHPWKANDGSKVAEYGIQVSFHPRYVNEFVGFVKADFDVPTTVFGLQDVLLTSPSPNETEGSYNIAVAIANGKQNMADRYETELKTVGNWVAENKETGGSVTVSSVVYNAAGGFFVVSLDTNDADYPEATKKIVFSLAAPATLAANGLEGFESNSVEIESNGVPA